MDCSLHWGRGSTQIKTQHSHSVWIDFFPEAIGEGLERVLSGGVLRKAGGGDQPRSGIDENDITFSVDESR